VRGLRLRRQEAVDVPLGAVLLKQLERYTVSGGVHCFGCGVWLADDAADVERWGYYGSGEVGKTYPYCASCTELRLVRR